MLYVLHVDGAVDEVDAACFAKIEPITEEFVCFDERGLSRPRTRP